MSMFRFYNDTRDIYGNSERGVAVYIYTAGTGVAATLYENDETTTKSNPIITDNTGLVDFKIPSGNYDFRYVKGDFDKTIEDIFLGANDNALNSEEWATNPEDNLISTGAGGDGTTDYSSLHWAAKASASAVAAALSETNASASETAALAAVGAVKITATDTTVSTLDTAVLVSSELTKTVNNPAADETLTLSLTDAGTTLAKMANLTAGEIIVGNASNRPSAAAVGTAGQVLTSGGTGVAPTMQDVNVGWTLISNATASASTSIEFTSGIDSTYDVYQVRGAGIRPATDGSYMFTVMSIDGGTTYLAGTTYTEAVIYSNSTAGPFTTWNSGTSNIRTQANGTDNTVATSCLNFEHTYSGLPSTTLHKHIYVQSTLRVHTSLNHDNLTGSSIASTASAVNAIKFFMNSGNIASGDFYLYGLKKA